MKIRSGVKVREHTPQEVTRRGMEYSSRVAPQDGHVPFHKGRGAGRPPGRRALSGAPNSRAFACQTASCLCAAPTRAWAISWRMTPRTVGASYRAVSGPDRVISLREWTHEPARLRARSKRKDHSLKPCWFISSRAICCASTRSTPPPRWPREGDRSRRTCAAGKSCARFQVLERRGTRAILRASTGVPRMRPRGAHRRDAYP